METSTVTWISRATPNKNSGQPEIISRGTWNELTHDCNILSGKQVPQRLYRFGTQKIGNFHGYVIISFLVTGDSILRIARGSSAGCFKRLSCRLSSGIVCDLSGYFASAGSHHASAKVGLVEPMIGRTPGSLHQPDDCPRSARTANR